MQEVKVENDRSFSEVPKFGMRDLLEFELEKCTIWYNMKYGELLCGHESGHFQAALNVKKYEYLFKDIDEFMAVVMAMEEYPHLQLDVFTNYKEFYNQYKKSPAFRKNCARFIQHVNENEGRG